MMSEAKFVLGVDLDGVVADFYEGMRKVAAEWLGVPLESLTKKVTQGLSEWGLDELGGYDPLHRFAVTQRDLFKNLPPIPGAPVALRKLSTRDVRIRIITHRLYIKYFHQEAVRQTIEWLDHHDIPYWDLCFMKDKAAVGANLYVEDSPSNVESLRRDGHETIVFANSTNVGMAEPRVETWEDAVRLVLDAQSCWQTSQKAENQALAGD
jgi:5'(3')-deoxyribonucleotidase